MAVTVTNLTQGPGELYTAAVSVTEPLDTAVATAPDPEDYTNVGGTMDGVELNVDLTYKELEVDQVVDIPGRRITKRELTLETNLAEPTLENLALAINGGTIATGGTGSTSFKSLTPVNDTSATQPLYKGVLFDGFAPGAAADGSAPRRRVLGRRVLSVEGTKFAYTKDKQSVFTLSLSCHYVSAGITPFKIIDQVLAA